MRSKRTIRIDSPIIKTSVWSAIDPGEVRKKNASVTWNRESEVMIVAPDMTPMMTVLCIVDNFVVYRSRRSIKAVIALLK